MNSRDEWEAALDESPADPQLRLVYADYLEEAGEPLKAAYHRWQASGPDPGKEGYSKGPRVPLRDRYLEGGQLTVVDRWSWYTWADGLTWNGEPDLSVVPAYLIEYMPDTKSHFYDGSMSWHFDSRRAAEEALFSAWLAHYMETLHLAHT